MHQNAIYKFPRRIRKINKSIPQTILSTYSPPQAMTQYIHLDVLTLNFKSKRQKDFKFTHCLFESVL